MPPSSPAPLSDLRVLFAAERTLQAWNRTSLALMAFGFLIERSSVFARTILDGEGAGHGPLPFWIGIVFILLGSFVSATILVQYMRIFRRLRGTEIRDDISRITGLVVSGLVSILGVVLACHLFLETN